MATDKFLSRLIAIAVVTYGIVALGTMCYQVLTGYEADKEVHDLTYLIVGGLIGRLTTSSTHPVPEGAQQVNVPDPLPAPAAAPVPVPAGMADPDGADPGILEPDPAP